MMQILPRYRALRVLCVEEDIVQRKLLEACLDVARIESIFAEGPQAALWLFRRFPVDMVLLDFDQHSHEELMAFRVMRDTSRHGRHVPILAVTNNDCRWTESSYREAGFAALFEKPMEPTRLFHAMDDVLRDAGQSPLVETWNAPQTA